jgi:hypothetical protein
MRALRFEIIKYTTKEPTINISGNDTHPPTTCAAFAFEVYVVTDVIDASHLVLCFASLTLTLTLATAQTRDEINSLNDRLVPRPVCTQGATSRVTAKLAVYMLSFDPGKLFRI